MKIGITIDVTKKSLFSSGINQNAIYLVDVFKKLGHDTYLIGSKTPADNINTELKLLGIEIISINDAINRKIKTDLIIELGYFLNPQIYKAVKELNSKIKLVSYQCGNAFITDAETVLHNSHKGRDNFKDDDRISPDQIWSIPQMENTNLSYYKYMMRCNNATVVPFVWSPDTIEKFSKGVNLKGWESREIKKIAVMEPNISVFKHIIFPIVILDLFLERGGMIDHVYGVGASIISKSKRFLNIIKRSRLFKEKKLSADPRIQTYNILKKHADLVLSWQWENPLNYLYFDVAWMGYPIVHNAELCQDVGYYYEGFNADNGAEVLEYAIKNHNNDAEYTERNREAIRRFTVENDNLIKDYGILLDNLINNKFKKFKYNWKNNSIE